MIYAADVRAIWDQIKPGVEQIHSSMPWVEWRPEDIYASCISGESALFVQDEKNPGASFFVAKVITSQSGERRFFIWVAWSPEEPGAEIANGAITDIAVKSNCTSIGFVTNNHTLVDHAKKYGFDKVMYDVRKNIGSGINSAL